MSLKNLLVSPNEAQIKAIKIELGEDTDRFENNVKLLEQWLDCQPHLPKNYDKYILGKYLRGCKHDTEVAKKKLEMLFVARTKKPEVFSVRKFSEKEMFVVNNTVVFPLPKLTPEGFRVSIMGLKDSNVDLFDFNIMQRLSFMFVQFRASKDPMSSGDVLIVDFANLKPYHVTKITIPQLTMVTIFLRKISFMRIKNIYIVNTPSYVDKLINAFKFLLSPKLQKRVVVDRGISCLKVIPRECLSKDYGGSELSVNEFMSLWLRCFEDNKEWFAHWETVQLLGPVPENSDIDIFDNFGTQGSFRKLNLD